MVRPVRFNRLPRLVNCPFNGIPVRCAPTTTISSIPVRHRSGGGWQNRRQIGADVTYPPGSSLGLM